MTRVDRGPPAPSSTNGAAYVEPSAEATHALRPRYGRFYGFEAATPPNAEIAAWAISGYR